jgi:rhodanese-related sulfurtransferase
MKKINNLVSLAIFLVFAFGSSAFALSSVEQKNVEGKSSVSVQKMIKDNNLEVVDYEYVLNAVGEGTRTGAKAILLDARPLKKYQASHIPSALALPDTSFEKMYDSFLGKVDKSKEIIVYCGGYKCIKSPIVAVELIKKGHKNVKVYIAGMPQWASKNYVEIDTNVAKAIFEKRDALFIDARPWAKFFGSTIIGSMNLPDTQFEKYTHLMPIDKKATIVTYCGGYGCHKSHIVAKKLVALGYTNVKVYAAGFPQWKDVGYPVTGSSAKATQKKGDDKPKISKSGHLMLGSDTGTVDGEWFIKNYKQLPKSVVLVDVRSSADFKSGTLPGAINVYVGDKKAPQFVEAVPKDKEIIFFCGTGTRAIEARGYFEELKKDLDRVFYLDANIECNKNNECKMEANEPIGI